jgi:hypothetical protein
MNDRLYRFLPDQGVFETGMAQGKQLLLADTVSDILLHWFAPNGEFLEMERIPIEPATMPPGQRQWRDGKVVAEGLNREERVKRQLAALKERIGFVPGEIAVRKFESEEAGIDDLPGEYQEFLDNREDYSKEDQKYFDGYIRDWRRDNCFVLNFYEQYWMSESGEVEHS